MSISIAMATYNAGPALDVQLRSLTTQSLLPDELVVVDDASSNDTVERLLRFRSWAPFSVIILTNDCNVGYADTFLRSASACKEEIIFFCDQDDYWLPNKLARVSAALTAQPSSMLACHKASVVDNELRPMGPAIVNRRPRSVDESPNGLTAAFRREILEIPWSDRPRGYCLGSHDAWVTFLAMAYGPIVWINEPLVLYRQHGDNAVGLAARRGVEAAVTATAHHYRSSARLARQRSEHANDLVSRDLDMKWRVALNREATRLNKLGAAYERRARLYESRRTAAGAIYNILGMTMQGDYGRRRLGLRALCKDVAITAVGSERLVSAVALFAKFRR